MPIRGKAIRAATRGKSTARAVERMRPQSVGRFVGRPMSGGKMAAQRVARATRPSVARISRTKQMASFVEGRGIKSSRLAAGGIIGALGVGAIMRRQPSVDKVRGVRNTGMYQF